MVCTRSDACVMSVSNEETKVNSEIQHCLVVAVKDPLFVCVSSSSSSCLLSSLPPLSGHGTAPARVSCMRGSMLYSHPLDDKSDRVDDDSGDEDGSDDDDDSDDDEVDGSDRSGDMVAMYVDDSMWYDPYI